MSADGSGWVAAPDVGAAAAGADADADAAVPATRRALIGYLPLYLFLFMVGAEMYLVSPLLPEVAADLDVSVTAAAHLVTAYVLVQAVAGPFLGLAYPRLGPTVMVGTGAALFVAGNAIAALTGDFALLVGSRALAGLGVATAGPAIWTWIATTAPDAVRGSAMGAGMAAFALGQVLGVPLGAFVADAAGWHRAFALLGVGAAVTLPLLLYGLRGARERPREPGEGPRALLKVWTHGPLRRTLAITFLFHAANLGAYTYLADVLDTRYDLSASALGTVGLLSGLGMFAGAALGGRVGDAARARGRAEDRLLPVWTLVLLVALVVAVGGRPLWLNVVAVLVWFLAAGAFDTNQQTLVASHAPGFTAVALSWNLAVLYGATSWGVWLMGQGDHRAGTVVAAGAVMAALAAAGSIAAVRRSG
ncbi:MFS transporter [Embleya sp. NPDC008237]|uniref:MFS transporter n=1 Tax=Embleya sp. NPDC008237 TaxID=3363978 RepID=UPI0036E37807